MVLTSRKKATFTIAAIFLSLGTLIGFIRSTDDATVATPKVMPSVLAPQIQPSAAVTSPEIQNLPVIGLLNADSAGIRNLAITPGTDDAVLDTGMAGAYPWSGPGKSGVFSVSAHRVGAGGPFLNLDKMKTGDPITLTDNNGVEYTYRVISVDVVAPDDISVLKGPKSESRLVLITCTPIETYADRLVVTAELEN
jgi:LPXTG-site transpeptidase (sortase) family protein